MSKQSYEGVEVNPGRRAIISNAIFPQHNTQEPLIIFESEICHMCSTAEALRLWL